LGRIIAPSRPLRQRAAALPPFLWTFYVSGGLTSLGANLAMATEPRVPVSSVRGTIIARLRECHHDRIIVGEETILYLADDVACPTCSGPCWRWRTGFATTDTKPKASSRHHPNIKPRES
jgi:hypothetical protein